MQTVRYRGSNFFVATLAYSVLNRSLRDFRIGRIYDNVGGIKKRPVRRTSIAEDAATTTTVLRCLSFHKLKFFRKYLHATEYISDVSQGSGESTTYSAIEESKPPSAFTTRSDGVIPFPLRMQLMRSWWAPSRGHDFLRCLVSWYTKF